MSVEPFSPTKYWTDYDTCFIYISCCRTHQYI